MVLQVDTIMGITTSRKHLGDNMAKTTKELKGCIHSNICKDKYLCCHFCNDKKCWCRCKDDLETCEYRDELPPPPPPKKEEEKKDKIDINKLKKV